LADFQQRELDRQNALRIAGLRNNNSGYGGYPHSASGGGGFNPATNWYSGSPVSSPSSSSNTPWNLPPGQTRANGYNPMPDSYLDQFYNQGTNPTVTTPTYDTTPSDWNNLLPPMSPDYGGPGGLSDEDYFNHYGG
jgi:hypothetical protein